MPHLIQKKFLVTGGAGFIGSHVVEALLKEGAKVYCTYRKLHKNTYFFEKQLNKKAVLIKCDLSNKLQVKKLLNHHQFEYIFHLAASLRPKNLKQAHKDNVLPTKNLLEAAKGNRVLKGVIIASTDRSKIKRYGLKDIKKLSKYPYDYSKTLSDFLAIKVINQKKIPVALIKYGNVFGPGDSVVKPPRLTAAIMEHLVQKKRFRPQGTGKERTAFVYVKDLAQAFVQAAKSIDKVRFKIINLPMPWNATVEEWYTLVEESVKKHTKTILKNQYKHNPLNWKPNTSLVRALQDTFRWYNGFFKP